ncbi:hypothetical protein [Thalassobacillus devorans]|uniref:hypothetical protein n=1 Tax=Thalassobacillus devorans TaxID=279813 RepID=UPI00049117DE|nr:hypothetical protein [Thalassobacillus devorans]
MAQNLVKKVVTQNFLLYKLYSMFRVGVFKERRNYVTSNTTFCVEGYPSSANTYFQYLLGYMLPDEIYAHHTHSLASVKESKLKNMPVVILIRQPVNTVASRVVRFDYDLDKAIDEYISFYQYINNNLDRFFILTFDEIINSDFSDLFKYIEAHNRKIDRNLTKRAEDYSQKRIEFKEKDESFVALPSEQKNKKKEEIKAIIQNHRNIDKANALYSNIVEKRNKFLSNN